MATLGEVAVHKEVLKLHELLKDKARLEKLNDKETVLNYAIMRFIGDGQ